MRLILPLLATLLLAAMPLPADSKTGHVWGVAQGTAQAGVGVVRGAGQAGVGVARGATTVAGRLVEACAASSRLAIVVSRPF